ncbi:hypothetical protein [Bacillus sp. CECT 9360]|uniref:hypothetical protein n=1 Tax=Bacillus sp. CECT 9360 TaxID=2845821 RepID=UPI001E337B9B|nr:hypothetical protein [Bacillus sp. CECT 9360]CAH0345153.1 hypothetical protein BCI9360_01432 [Bacillus sp. CECT 9360]
MPDVYTLYHYVSKPIMISHNVVPAYPSPLLFYITKVNPTNMVGICRNAAGVLMDNVTFNYTDITQYQCVN